MNKKRFIPLNVKLTFAVILALFATLVLYIFIGWIQEIVVAKYYQSEAAVKANVGAAYASLTKYIAENGTNATDTDALQSWLKRNDYTYLEVYDNTTIAFNGGWAYSSTYTGKSSFSATGKNYVYINENATERITREVFSEDVRNRIISFADGEYYVYIDVYKEQHFYNIVFLVRTVMCLFVFMGVIVIYNTKVIHKMTRLSREVQAVSDGDLDAEIDPTSNDEIGRLAVSVDTMRNSIVEKLQSEKIAWDANTQLITAMSHDIRTPLTSLIGYLDIIESGKYKSREEGLKYIASCREKAFQLRDMSDKLFQYFLVFGSQEEREKNYEVFDAGILLQQLISEHSAELINYGFDIDFEYEVADVNIMADIQGIRRLFDNVFSNIIKYADKSYHIRISAVLENDKMTVRLINSVLAVSRKVESNKIGLKTCERICSDMGGAFSYHDEGQLFTARITLPVYHGPEKPVGADTGDSDNDKGSSDFGGSDGHNAPGEIPGQSASGETPGQSALDGAVADGGRAAE